jgi:CheY-like chemotaxis protein
MAANLQRLKVVVADDSKQMRSVVSGFLNAIGIANIREAKDANDAWDLCGSFNPDMMVADWNMPPTSGLDLVRRIRTAPDSPNKFLPIILLTAFNEEHRIVEARNAGISEFMLKPVTAGAFFDRVMALVEDDREFVETKTFFGPDRRRGVRPPYQGPERRGGR